MTLTSCTISGNVAVGSGAGVASSNGAHDGTYATLTMSNCIVSNNSAYFQGGGIGNGDGSSATLTDCTVINNTAGLNSPNSRAGGGGIANGGGGGGGLTLIDSVITGNAAPNGGGISNYAGTANVDDSTLSGNMATKGDGGAIDNLGFTFTYGVVYSHLSLSNSTISRDSAQSGGGIFGYIDTLNATNSTQYDNSAQAGARWISRVEAR